MITACSPDIPAALFAQLAEGGIMVAAGRAERRPVDMRNRKGKRSDGFQKYSSG
jgi:Protein-L-isoaspartate(D-aspartate) O-methyltransferase (PCMT).